MPTVKTKRSKAPPEPITTQTTQKTSAEHNTTTPLTSTIFNFNPSLISPQLLCRQCNVSIRENPDDPELPYRLFHIGLDSALRDTQLHHLHTLAMSSEPQTSKVSSGSDDTGSLDVNMYPDSVSKGYFVNKLKNPSSASVLVNIWNSTSFGQLAVCPLCGFPTARINVKWSIAGVQPITFFKPPQFKTTSNGFLQPLPLKPASIMLPIPVPKYYTTSSYIEVIDSSLGSFVNPELDDLFGTKISHREMINTDRKNLILLYFILQDISIKAAIPAYFTDIAFDICYQTALSITSRRKDMKAQGVAALDIVFQQYLKSHREDESKSISIDEGESSDSQFVHPIDLFLRRITLSDLVAIAGTTIAEVRHMQETLQVTKRGWDFLLKNSMSANQLLETSLLFPLIRRISFPSDSQSIDFIIRLYRMANHFKIIEPMDLLFFVLSCVFQGARLSNIPPSTIKDLIILARGQSPDNDLITSALVTLSSEKHLLTGTDEFAKLVTEYFNSSFTSLMAKHIYQFVDSK